MNATLQQSGMAALPVDELALVDSIVPRLSRPESGLEWSSSPAFAAADVDPDGGIAYHADEAGRVLYAIPVSERGAGKADATTRAVRTNNEVTLPENHLTAALGLPRETIKAAHDDGDVSEIRLAVFARPGVIAFRRASTLAVPGDVQAELATLSDRSLFE